MEETSYQGASDSVATWLMLGSIQQLTCGVLILMTATKHSEYDTTHSIIIDACAEWRLMGVVVWQIAEKTNKVQPINYTSWAHWCLPIYISGCAEFTTFELHFSDARCHFGFGLNGWKRNGTSILSNCDIRRAVKQHTKYLWLLCGCCCFVIRLLLLNLATLAGRLIIACLLGNLKCNFFETFDRI